MVQPIYKHVCTGIIGYRPRAALWLLHGDKIILQVCERFNVVHPFTKDTIRTYRLWRDAKASDFIPPSIPSAQMYAIAA